MIHEPAETADSRIRLGYTIDLHYDVFSTADFVFSVHAARTAQQRILHEALVVEPAVDWRVDTKDKKKKKKSTKKATEMTQKKN